MGLLLISILVLILIGALPTWPHSKKWGYYPSSGLGLILIFVLVLLLMGRI
ncbi:DUF3309 family protein [Desulfovibrio psychrotolerans]|uniref:DUF3309 family protein n=1 Tax=Desulfovibrio psychrotolerans TaxID=415242 RepID=UPI00157B94D7|nr:DUF3309 family protein [Desulfovibrio psychrotolerans]